MSPDRPNILFIMCDDHAAQAISAYGSRINRTPNIDRICDSPSGSRFDNCYVTNSICTPSRAAILTGTYNHVNRVTTLDTPMDNQLPNVAKHLRTAGYQTGMFGKWHLGEGPAYKPSGFDEWKVLPGQGEYYNPTFHTPQGVRRDSGYVTDIITDDCIQFLDHRDPDKPFFLMCHHKAPHRPWQPDERHRSLYPEVFWEPPSLDDTYDNRARAAAAAKMRIAEDLTFDDLDLLPLRADGLPMDDGAAQAKIPYPADGHSVSMYLRETGETVTFSNRYELKRFKYNRYIRRYVQTVHSIDVNTGRLIDYLMANSLWRNTIVVYTSDQGFFLGEHGWFDKRFIYEESLRMPLLVHAPGVTPAQEERRVNTAMVCNVDFAPTFLELAGVSVPSYMQGRSIAPLLRGDDPPDWPMEVYHRYWMNQDDVHNAYAHYGIRTNRYKLIYWYNDDCGQSGANPGTDEPEWELFDLEHDPLELRNCYDDPAYQQAQAELIERLNRKMAEIGDSPMHR